MLSDRDAELVEAVAVRVVEMLGTPAATSKLVDAATLAAQLGVSREYVYRHQRELGGKKISGSEKAPIRFAQNAALHAFQAIEEPKPVAPKPVRSRRGDLEGVKLLPVKGRS